MMQVHVRSGELSEHTFTSRNSGNGTRLHHSPSTRAKAAVHPRAAVFARGTPHKEITSLFANVINLSGGKGTIAPKRGSKGRSPLGGGGGAAASHKPPPFGRGQGAIFAQLS